MNYWLQGLTKYKFQVYIYYNDRMIYIYLMNEKI